MKKTEAQDLAEQSQEEITNQVKKIFDPKSLRVENVRKSNQLLVEEAVAVVHMTRDHLGFKILNEEISKRYEYLEVQLMTVDGMEKVNKIRSEIQGIMTVRTLIEQIVQKGRIAALAIDKESRELEEPREF